MIPLALDWPLPFSMIRSARFAYKSAHSIKVFTDFRRKLQHPMQSFITIPSLINEKGETVLKPWLCSLKFCFSLRSFGASPRTGPQPFVVQASCRHPSISRWRHIPNSEYISLFLEIIFHLVGLLWKTSIYLVCLSMLQDQVRCFLLQYLTYYKDNK